MKTVTLNGWAQPHDGLGFLFPDAAHIPYSEMSGEDELAQKISLHSPDLLVGWSLGGQLAARLVADGVVKPKGMVLIAPPYQYVATKEFSSGMAPEMYKTFRSSYVENNERTIAKFAALIGKGDIHQREITRALSDTRHAADAARWLPWLEDLAAFEPQPMNFKQLPPTLIVHGKNDHIVHPAQGKIWAEKIPSVRLELWEDTGHAPHLHDPVRFKALVDEFTAGLA